MSIARSHPFVRVSEKIITTHDSSHDDGGSNHESACISEKRPLKLFAVLSTEVPDVALNVRYYYRFLSSCVRGVADWFVGRSSLLSRRLVLSWVMRDRCVSCLMSRVVVAY